MHKGKVTTNKRVPTCTDSVCSSEIPQIQDTVVTHRINETISFSGVQFLVNPVSDGIDSEK